MRHIKAITSLGIGLSRCIKDPKLRRLAMWPWAIGIFAYLLCLGGIYYGHMPILHRLVGVPLGFFSWILYCAAWLGVGLFLVMASLVTTYALVMVIAGPFQSAIALAILQEHGLKAANENSIIAEVVKGAGRELLKLIWIVPLMLIVFLAGLIPFLAPVALALNAWLLGYQFFDITLDVLNIPIRQRLKLTSRHAIKTALFGLAVTVFFLIPLLGALLAPAAAAGAAIFLAESGLLKDSK